VFVPAHKVLFSSFSVEILFQTVILQVSDRAVTVR